MLRIHAGGVDIDPQFCDAGHIWIFQARRYCLYGNTDEAMQDGFTLTEVLLGFFIAGLLAVAATPSLMHSAQGMQLHTRTQAVIGLLERARRSALTGQASVMVCSGSSDGCEASWDAPQLAVFYDLNADEHLDAGDYLLQVLPVSDVRLVWNGFRRGVPIGFKSREGTGRNAGSLYLCPLDGAVAQRILLHSSGRVRHEPCEDCQACTP